MIILEFKVLAWKFIPNEAKIYKINLEYQNNLNTSYKLEFLNSKVEENCHFVSFTPILAQFWPFKEA